jgi:hypothetical protein
MAGKPVHKEIDPMHLNPHCAVLRAVPDALADTGMGVDEALMAQANGKGVIFRPKGEA